MTLPTIFCPNCNTLILDADYCHVCGWQRVQPQAAGEITWAAALETPLSRNRGGGGSRPLESNGVVFVPTEKGSIFAVGGSADNNIIWRYQLDKDYRCDAIVRWNNSLILGSEYGGGFPQPVGNLIALNIETGTELWRIPVDGASVSAPAIHNHIAYCTVNTNILCAIDLNSREIIWEKQLPPGWLWSPNAPAVNESGSILVMPGRSDTLLAFQLQRKRLLWSFKGKKWFPYSPVIVRNIVYIRSWDKNIYAINIETGEELWRYPAPRDFTSDIAVDVQFVYVGAKEEAAKTYALHIIDRNTGKLVQNYVISGHIYGRPTSIGATVFFASDDRTYNDPDGGTIYALDTTNQTLLWSTSVPERFQCDLTVSQNNVIAGTRQGVIYAFSFRTNEITVKLPQTYFDHAEYENAAIAWALKGKYIEAAKIYEKQLNNPYLAAQLYMKAKAYENVYKLLGKSKVATESELAIKAIGYLSTNIDKAMAFASINKPHQAAEAYLAANEYELAGGQFEAAKEWDKAIEAYKQANSEEKLQALLRQLNRQDELLKRYLRFNDFADAAEIYFRQGNYFEAGKYFDLAGDAQRAIESFQKIPEDEDLSPDKHLVMGNLAKTLKYWAFAISHLSLGGDFIAAAEIARDHLKDNEQAIELFKQGGGILQAAEMLEQMERFAEAAEAFKEAREERRAGECIFQQVKKRIKDTHGVMYVKNDPEIIEWLTEAIQLFDGVFTYAPSGSDEKIQCQKKMEDCRVILAKVRAEPIYKISVSSKPLVYGEGNTVEFKITNEGWGPTPFLLAKIAGDFIKSVTDQTIGILKSAQSYSSSLIIVPTLRGQVQFNVHLLSSEQNEKIVYTSTPYPFKVIPSNNALHEIMDEANDATININIDKYSVGGLEISESAIVNRGNIGIPGSSDINNLYDTGITPKADVARYLESRREEVQVCPNCKKSIAPLLATNPDAKHCTYCGALLYSQNGEV